MLPYFHFFFFLFCIFSSLSALINVSEVLFLDSSTQFQYFLTCYQQPQTSLDIYTFWNRISIWHYIPSNFPFYLFSTSFSVPYAWSLSFLNLWVRPPFFVLISVTCNILSLSYPEDTHLRLYYWLMDLSLFHTYFLLFMLKSLSSTLCGYPTVVV